MELEKMNDFFAKRIDVGAEWGDISRGKVS